MLLDPCLQLCCAPPSPRAPGAAVDFCVLFKTWGGLSSHSSGKKLSSLGVRLLLEQSVSSPGRYLGCWATYGHRTEVIARSSAQSSFSVCPILLPLALPQRRCSLINIWQASLHLSLCFWETQSETNISEGRRYFCRQVLKD